MITTGNNSPSSRSTGVSGFVATLFAIVFRLEGNPGDIDAILTEVNTRSAAKTAKFSRTVKTTLEGRLIDTEEGKKHHERYARCLSTGHTSTECQERLVKDIRADWENDC